MKSGRLTLVRAWAGVHPTRSALILLAVATLLSLTGARAAIDNLGFLLFDTPVPLLLLVPVLAAVAVAMGSDNTARLPLPQPPRLACARLLWLLTLTALAACASNLGQLADPVVDWQPTTRNLLLYTSLTITTATLASPALAWLPPVTLTVVAMFFGYRTTQPGYHWWATIMEQATSPAQWSCATASFLVAALLHTVHPVTTSHIGSFTAASAR
ncbi:hypothetical protein ABZ567_28370 [Streptomyces sp. NPDC016459]|uniref:hypothetical protein n=1 Tax=Streptomyces sp. NPDC016459 TaxID=3157190 RepID=UPI0034107CF8